MLDASYRRYLYKVPSSLSHSRPSAELQYWGFSGMLLYHCIETFHDTASPSKASLAAPSYATISNIQRLCAIKEVSQTILAHAKGTIRLGFGVRGCFFVQDVASEGIAISMSLVKAFCASFAKFHSFNHLSDMFRSHQDFILQHQ